jgi:hypothetical protein
MYHDENPISQYHWEDPGRTAEADGKLHPVSGGPAELSAEVQVKEDRNGNYI